MKLFSYYLDKVFPWIFLVVTLIVGIVGVQAHEYHDLINYSLITVLMFRVSSMVKKPEE